MSKPKLFIGPPSPCAQTCRTHSCALLGKWTTLLFQSPANKLGVFRPFPPQLTCQEIFPALPSEDSKPSLFTSPHHSTASPLVQPPSPCHLTIGSQFPYSRLPPSVYSHLSSQRCYGSSCSPPSAPQAPKMAVPKRCPALTCRPAIPPRGQRGQPVPRPQGLRTVVLLPEHSHPEIPSLPSNATCSVSPPRTLSYPCSDCLPAFPILLTPLCCSPYPFSLSNTLFNLPIYHLLYLLFVL